ncbi:MAG: lytic transglycosylase domain-containing protein [Thiobacillus sp.]
MATKSIIKIDVDDSQFQDFYKLFQDFQSRVDGLPKDWGKVTGATEESGAAFVEMVAEANKLSSQAGKLSGEMQKVNQQQKEFAANTRSSEKSMKSMSDHSSSMLSNLSKGGAILGAVLAGVKIADMLGKSAVEGQKSARGLGLNQGQVRAFGTDFSRYINPSMLGNVANAQNDLTKREYLAMASGTGYAQAGKESVDSLTIKTMLRAHDWWASHADHSSQALQAAGFSQIGYSMEDMRRLGHTPRSELEAGQSQYNQDKNALAVTDNHTAGWYKYTRGKALLEQRAQVGAINVAGSLNDYKSAPASNISVSGKIVGSHRARLAAIESANGLPAGTLDAIWAQESGRGKHAGLSSAGALGDFQFTKATAAAKGITDRTSFDQESLGAGSLMKEDLARYHGNMRKALAAYNWGTVGLDKDIKANGSSWESHAPAETRNYINQILARMNKAPTVNLNITNKTGADISVTANALGH